MPLYLDNTDQQALLDWSLILTPGASGGHWPVGYSSAMGVFDSDAEDPNAPRAVMVMVNTDPRILDLHFSSDQTKKWATRNIMRGLFGYMFLVRRVRRLQAKVLSSNTSMMRFALQCGFRPEGTLREYAGPGLDAVLLGMLADDCAFLDPSDKEALRNEQPIRT